MSIKNDIQIIRSLAKEYFKVMNDPHNAERMKLHRAVNDKKMIRPVVLIEELPWGQMNVNNELTCYCTDPDLRKYESYMRNIMFRFNHFRADMIVRPFLPVKKIIRTTGIGLEVEEQRIQADKTTHIVAHEYHDMFEDRSNLEKLHNEVITYDETETNREFNKIGDVIGDILPIKKVGENHVSVTTWDTISRYRGVTPLLMDLIEDPDFSHALVKKLNDITMDKYDQYLKLGLFDNDPTFLHATACPCSDLHPEEDNKDLKNIWGRGAAQIFASVGKDMHEEFDINYMKETVGKCGLTYYGCCEPLDRKIDIVEKIPNLRKISITPWADVNVAAEAIDGRYVIASKPNPASVGVPHLDKEALKKEITTIVDACYKYNCSFDMVLKDISTCSNNPQNIFDWNDIVMDIITNY